MAVVVTLRAPLVLVLFASGCGASAPSLPDPDGRVERLLDAPYGTGVVEYADELRAWIVRADGTPSVEFARSAVEDSRALREAQGVALDSAGYDWAAPPSRGVGAALCVCFCRNQSDSLALTFHFDDDEVVIDGHGNDGIGRACFTPSRTRVVGLAKRLFPDDADAKALR